MSFLMKLFRDEEGQGLTEYALILGAIAIAVVVILLLIGGHISNIFNRVENELNNVYS